MPCCSSHRPAYQPMMSTLFCNLFALSIDVVAQRVSPRSNLATTLTALLSNPNAVKGMVPSQCVVPSMLTILPNQAVQHIHSRGISGLSQIVCCPGSGYITAGSESLGESLISSI